MNARPPFSSQNDNILAYSVVLKRTPHKAYARGGGILQGAGTDWRSLSLNGQNINRGRDELLKLIYVF